MQADQAIKNRKTAKVLADTPWAIPNEPQKVRTTIDELLDLAAFAPFHHTCNEQYRSKNKLNSCVPWRFYVFDTSNCRSLLNHMNAQEIKAGKISSMLSSASALFLVTWLPEPKEVLAKETNVHLFDGNLKNMEHIAASSAAIQNVLIGATARDIPNYWSSGGVLRKQELFEYVQIPSKEIMLGALFLFPKDSHQRKAIIKPGALRNKGKEKNTWSKLVDLDTP